MTVSIVTLNLVYSGSASLMSHNIGLGTRFSTYRTRCRAYFNKCLRHVKKIVEVVNNAFEKDQTSELVKLKIEIVCDEAVSRGFCVVGITETFEFVFVFLRMPPESLFM
jgi:hypothetical protein